MSLKIFTNASLLLIMMLSSAITHAEATWIDVRSELEHRIDRIEGDVRISHSEIVQQASKLFPDKDTEIKLYCLSGGRAGKAMSALQEAGYSKVSNAGGIRDARKQRGLE